MSPQTAQALVILGLIGFVAVAVVLAYVLMAGLGLAFARRPDPDGETLADRAAAVRPPRGKAARFDADFDRMIRGTQFGLTAEAAVGWILLAGALAAVLVYLFVPDVLAALVAFLAGASIPLVVFLANRNRRKRAIQEQLPDGCFQLARSLRSGLSLTQALRETATYLPAPLAPLYDRLAAALTLGESTPNALKRVADDAAVTEFDLLTAVIATNTESGGNLPAMLDRLAASIRDRNQFRGYFRTTTALGRLSGFFLAAAAPVTVVLYLIFQQELFLKFLDTGLGQTLLVVAVVLEIVGLAWLLYLLSGQDDY